MTSLSLNVVLDVTIEKGFPMQETFQEKDLIMVKSALFLNLRYKLIFRWATKLALVPGNDHPELFFVLSEVLNIG